MKKLIAVLIILIFSFESIVWCAPDSTWKDGVRVPLAFNQSGQFTKSRVRYLLEADNAEELDRAYTIERRLIEETAAEARIGLVPAQYQAQALKGITLKELIKQLRCILQDTSDQKPPLGASFNQVIGTLKPQIELIVGMHAALVVRERELSQLVENDRIKADSAIKMDLDMLWHNAKRKWPGGIFDNRNTDTDILTAIQETFELWLKYSEQIIEEARTEAMEQSAARYRLRKAQLKLDIRQARDAVIETAYSQVTRTINSLEDKTLLREIAPVFVNSHPLLQRAMALLTEYVQLRTEAISALQARNLNLLKVNYPRLCDINNQFKEIMRKFLVSPEAFTQFDNELGEILSAISFLEGDFSGSHVFVEFSINDIAQRLVKSRLVNENYIIMQQAGISIDKINEKWWPEFREFLYFWHFCYQIEANNTLRPEERQCVILDYLLSRINAGQLNPLSAEEWWLHPSRMAPEEAYQTVESLVEPLPPETQVSIEQSEPKTEKIAVQWLARHWKTATVISLVAAVGVAGFLAFQSDHQGLSLTKGAPALEPYVPMEGINSDVLGAGQLLEQLRKAQDPAQIDMAQAGQRAMARENIEKELRQIEKTQSQAQRRIEAHQKKVVKVKATVDTALESLKKVQASAIYGEVSKEGAEAQKARQKFNANTRNLKAGVREAFIERLRQKIPRIKGRGIDGFGETQDVLTPSIELLGERRIVMVFQKPISGFFREATYEHFDISTSQWVSEKPSTSNTTSIIEMPGANAANSVTAKVYSSFTPLALPSRYAPIPESFTFSEAGVRYDVRQDKYGHYFLWTRNARFPIEAAFNITKIANEAWRSVPPSPETRVSMKTDPWQPDTQAALEKAMKQPDFNAQINTVLSHISGTSEYTLSDSLNKRHHMPPGHYVGNIDRNKIELNGQSFRFLNCAAANTLFPSQVRAIGYPARIEIGYLLSRPATEVSTWMRHGITSVVNPGLKQWQEFDATPPDRFPNGDERRFQEELPIAQPAAQAIREAKDKYQEALHDLDQAQQLLKQKEQTLGRIEKQQKKAREKLKALDKEADATQSSHLRIMEVLSNDLGNASMVIQKLARDDPAGLTRALLDPSSNLWASYYHSFNEANIPSAVQVRFSASILEIAMKHLPPEYTRTLHVRYAQVLQQWLADDTTLQPVVLFFARGDAQERTIKQWNASTSFPIAVPMDKSISPLSETVRVLIPSKQDTGAPSWVQAEDGTIRGFITRDQFFDEAGHPMFNQSFKATSVGPAAASPDGRLYALVDGGIQDVLTGRLTKYSGMAVKQLVFGSDTMEVYCVLRHENGNEQIAAFSSDQKDRLKSITVQTMARFHLFETIQRKIGIIRITIQNQGNSYVVDIFDLNLYHKGSVSLPKSPSDNLESVEGKIQFKASGTSMKIVYKNPGYNVGLYRIPLSMKSGVSENNKGELISPTGLQDVTFPVFDRDNPILYYAVKLAGSASWTILEADKPLGKIDESCELIGLYNRVLFLKKRVEDKVEFVLQSIEGVVVGKVGPYPINDVTDISVSQGWSQYSNNSHKKICFRHKRGDGAWELRVVLFDPDAQSLREFVASSPEASDVSQPLLVNIESNIVFAQKINNEWQWRLNEWQWRLNEGRWMNEGFENMPLSKAIYVEHVEPGDKGAVTIGARLEFHHFDENNNLYEWKGPDLRWITSGSMLRRSRKGLYYSLLDPITRKRCIWRTGDRFPISLPDSISINTFEVDSHGRLYYSGTLGEDKKSSVWQEGVPEPLFPPREGKIESIHFAPDGTGYCVLRLKNWKAQFIRLNGTAVSKEVDYGGYGREPLGYYAIRDKGAGTSKSPGINIIRLHDNRVMQRYEGKSDSPYITESFFAPDGTVYYIVKGIKGVTNMLIRLQDGAIISHSSYLSRDPDLQVGISRDGNFYYLTELEKQGRSLVRLSDGHVVFSGLPKDYGYSIEFPPHSSTGIFFSSSHGRFQYPGGDIIGGNSAGKELEWTGSRLQEGPKGTAVLLAYDKGIIGNMGKEQLMILDPDQEMDRLLQWAIIAQLSNPELTQTEAWKGFRNHLIARVERSTGPFMPSDRRLKMALFTQGTAYHNLYMQKLAKLSSMPGHHQEAREALAGIVRGTFSAYRQKFGDQPFNPEGVQGDDLLSRVINRDLQVFESRPQPVRITKFRQQELLKFNRQVLDLTTVLPWLRFSPQDLQDTWLDQKALMKRLLTEMPQQITMLILFAELLGAIAGRYALYKQKASREHFNKLLMHWVSEMDRAVFLLNKIKKFSLRDAVKQLSESEQQQLAPYVEVCKDAPPQIQAAVWFIVSTDGLMPEVWSRNERVKRSINIFRLKRLLKRAFKEREREKQWSELTERESQRPVVEDTVSLGHFLEALLELKGRLRSELQETEIEKETPLNGILPKSKDVRNNL